MLRRVLAIAAGLLLLNVSAAEALRVCAAEAPQPAAAAEHHHDHGAPAPTDKPVQTECCAAMSSCTVSVEIAGASDENSAIPESHDIWAALDGAPLAQVFSPDPPPPKHEA